MGLAALGVGAATLGVAVHMGAFDKPKPKPKRKKGSTLEDLPPPQDETNKPPGKRDEPRAERELYNHEVGGPDQALEFIGEEVAAKSIRDGRPTIYLVMRKEDRKAEKHKELRAGMSKRSLSKVGYDHHTALVTTNEGPENTVLIGAIYQQPNGIWTATMPTPDMILEGESYDADAKLGKIVGFLKGTQEPADFTELTPEQARLVREGASVAEAVQQTQGTA